MLESTQALTQSEVLHSWRFEPWSYIYLDLGIRCGFLPAVLRRFPHLHIHCIVQNYVWFFPVLDWFSIQLGLVLKVIILDLATGISLFLSQNFAAFIAQQIRAWISWWNLSNFVRYIQAKKDNYDDGKNIDQDNLMTLAENKYKALVVKKSGIRCLMSNIKLFHSLLK